MFRMFSWNARGINDLRKRDVLKSFLRDRRRDLTCFQETKLEDVLLSVIRSLWGQYSVCLCFLRQQEPLGAL